MTAQTNKKQVGFTLIELLIVISIIAVLAVIGIGFYSSSQGRSRDARRAADMDAIASTLESNYTETSATPYALSAGIFSSATVPTDPQSTDRSYCFYSTTGAVSAAMRTAVPAVTGWTTAACPAVAGWTANVLSASSSVTGMTGWKICFLNDDKTAISCKNSTR
jgi:prepilin-type N-terminal cleavage/methylation domain-containing protein